MNPRLAMALILTLLIGMSSAVFNVQRAKASGTIYIRADGSIDPPTVPISSVDNVTYTFTDNIYNSIALERNNTVLDGAGYMIQGTGSGTGIDLNERTNVTIKNVKINAFHDGIRLRRSFNNTVSGSDITANNSTGIFLDDSSTYNSISGNNIMANDWAGIELIGSSSNRISGNKITNNGVGIVGSASSNNSISGNNITANNVGEGIWLSSGDNNSIFGNDIIKNKDDGIVIAGSNNRIFGNNIIANNYYGIAILSSDSQSNLICHNNFVNNDIQAYISNSANVWDDGYPSGGNYWSNYVSTDLKSGLDQNETGSDGISDSAITIPPYPVIDNVDHYPLMGMYSDFNVTYFTPPLVSHTCDVTVISNSTVSDFVAPIWIEHPEVIFLEFNVIGAEGSTGFCRVSFPTAMMNGTYHVTVNGTEIPYTLLSCSDTNDTYLHFTYTHSTETVIITPEFPSFIILPLFMIAPLLAVIVYRRKRTT